KRAAFAMFYAPLHFLLIREIVRALCAVDRSCPTILDLGCGTGVGSAAWALAFSAPPKIIAVDVNAWAVQEAQWTYRSFGLRASTRASEIRKTEIREKTAVLAAFTINELDDGSRDHLLDRFLKASASGSPILVVEPIARRLTRWWDEWAAAFTKQHGRADDWR